MRIRQDPQVDDVANVAQDANGQNDDGQQVLTMNDVNNILLAANSQVGNCAPNDDDNPDPNLNYNCQIVTTPNGQTTLETFTDDTGNVVQTQVTTNQNNGANGVVAATQVTNAQNNGGDDGDDAADDNDEQERMQTNQQQDDQTDDADQGDDDNQDDNQDDQDNDNGDDNNDDNGDDNDDNDGDDNDDNNGDNGDDGNDDEDDNQDDDQDDDDQDLPTQNQNRCLQNVNACMLLIQNPPINWNLYYECYNNALQTAF